MNRWICAITGTVLFATSTLFGGTGYTQTNLVSDDGSIAGTKTDSQLVNPWGLVASPGGPWWVSNNGTGSTSVYDGSGNTVIGPFAVPGAPTGVVFNGSTGFKVGPGGSAGPASFIYVGEDGAINGWAGGASAVAAPAPNLGAVYKGAALAANAGKTLLYTADFHNGKIQVFDSNFAQVSTSGSFSDATLPAGYAPFNIANIGGNLYVSYAQQDRDKHDDVAGAGHGFIDIFKPDGTLVGRFASGGSLNSPWGMTMAPANYGQFSNDLLIGNFGDGTIHAFDPNTHALLGTLGTDGAHPLVIGDLWALQFADGGIAGKSNQLFFTAGVSEESHGLFGFIAPSSGGPSAVPLPPAAYAGAVSLLLVGWTVRRWGRAANQAS
jgi:uncharacterized protein (TIGR03118 family)